MQFLVRNFFYSNNKHNCLAAESIQFNLPEYLATSKYVFSNYVSVLNKSKQQQKYYITFNIRFGFPHYSQWYFWFTLVAVVARHVERRHYRVPSPKCLIETCLFYCRFFKRLQVWLANMVTAAKPHFFKLDMFRSVKLVGHSICYNFRLFVCEFDCLFA